MSRVLWALVAIMVGILALAPLWGVALLTFMGSPRAQAVQVVSATIMAIWIPGIPLVALLLARPGRARAQA